MIKTMGLAALSILMAGCLASGGDGAICPEGERLEVTETCNNYDRPCTEGDWDGYDCSEGCAVVHCRQIDGQISGFHQVEGIPEED